MKPGLSGIPTLGDVVTSSVPDGGTLAGADQSQRVGFKLRIAKISRLADEIEGAAVYRSADIGRDPLPQQQRPDHTHG